MTLDQLNQRYSDLCMQLGHLMNNLKKVNAAIASIESEIEAIDKAAGALKEKEAKDAATHAPEVIVPPAAQKKAKASKLVEKT